MGPIQRTIVKASMRSVRHPWTTLLISLAALVGCVVLAATRLPIDTDQNQLFSESEVYFRDYVEFSRKFPENEAVYVVIRAKDDRASIPLDRWAAAAEAVVAKVSPLTKYVERVEYRAPSSTLGQWGLLFDTPENVERNRAEINEFTPLMRAVGQKPGLDALVLGTAPAERFYQSMKLSPPKDFARSPALAAEVSRSLQLSLAGPAATGPELERLGGSPRELGYFFEIDQQDRRAVAEKKLSPADARYLLLIRVKEKREFNSLGSISETVDAIRDAARSAVTPQTFPEFTVALTGRPVLEADEMRTSEHDTRISEIVAGIAVFIGLILFLMPWSELRHAASWKGSAVIFLRGVWLALVAEISLATAIGWTFGWATLTVGRLNLLSLVFVIALIGIGMDYLVQVLARYRREAQRYQRATAVWARVFRYVSPPISTACMGAAGAFLVSVLTPFRGAAELGIIAGGGLFLCLLSGYTVLPALLTIFPPRLRLKDVSKRYATKAPRAGGWRLLFPAAWIVAAAALVPTMTRVSFDPNLLNLQAAGLESVELVRHLETWYAVALSDDLETLRKVDAALMARKQQTGLIERTDSLVTREHNAAFLQRTSATLPKVDWAAPAPLPDDRIALFARVLAELKDRYAALNSPDGTDAARQIAAVLAELEKHPPAEAARRISAWQALFVGALRDGLAQFTPPPLKIADLPPEVRDHFVHLADAGKSGRSPTYALYIYPTEDLWDQQHLAAFVRDIESAVAPLQTGNAPPKPGGPDTRNFVLTGIAPELYHTTQAIQWSFYKATLYALALIFVLVLIDLRSITQTLIAISVLAIGLPMLLAIMGFLSSRLGEHAYLVHFNLANFFGLPILIGAGHEYGVFMVHRYKEVLHNPRRVWRPWDTSDRALLLCAYITCSAFAFLLLGRHRGMQSLGFVMAVGIACIYLATVIVVRPLLLWRLQSKARHGSPAAATKAAGPSE